MPPDPLQFRVPVSGEGSRLDKFLCEQVPEASRTQIQRWIESDRVRVNGLPAKKNTLLAENDAVELIRPAEAEPSHLEPENIPLEIVYEDAYLAVVNKPKGMVTHPGHGVQSGTLANALAYHFRRLSDLGGSDRPGIVHRLDRDTSGLLVVARDNATHASLSKALAERRIHRTYAALCWRELPQSEGTYDSALGRHPNDPLRRAVRPDGKPAVTHYRALQWFQFATSVEVRLETGRTHQIRVHFSQAGFPIVGDPLYGGREGNLARLPQLLQSPAAGLLKRLSSQALHALRLEFTHPHDDSPREFSVPLPAEFQAALDYLKPYQRAETP